MLGLPSGKPRGVVRYVRISAAYFAAILIFGVCEGGILRVKVPISVLLQRTRSI